MVTGPRVAAAGAVSSLAPFAHVADVERSLAFYALLGFVPLGRHSSPAGRTVWANALAGGAHIMFAQASGPIDAGVQAVLFYMYADDVRALRARLLSGGAVDGGVFTGQPGAEAGRPVVFEVEPRFYMPRGELRVHDPDGYVILIGQRD